ncbi:MAG: hypothetical protein ACJ72Z_10415 [Pyrinomonadaceae bacterium]
MNKKFLITGVACTVVGFALSFLIHGVLLSDEYMKLVSSGIFRSETEAQGLFHFMIIANVLIGFAFAWIYLQGIESGVEWWKQGLRFGLAVACLAAIPMYLIYYVIEPMPGMLVVKQIVFDTGAMLVNGLVAAFINKERMA